jgi:hypothetical protein
VLEDLAFANFRQMVRESRCDTRGRCPQSMCDRFVVSDADKHMLNSRLNRLDLIVKQQL